MDDYETIHRSARTELPWAVEMEQLFGSADHFITHFGFPNKDTNTWHTCAYFGGRYEVSMDVQVKVDYANKRIVLAGEPRFQIIEKTYVELRDGGQVASGVGNQMEFGIDEWEKVVAAKGDFSVIGFPLNPEPTPDFDVFLRARRGPRVPISLLK